MDLSATIKGSKQCAIVLFPKQPFNDWANILTEEEGMFCDKDNIPSIYLFPEYKAIDEIQDALPRIYDKLFYAELRDLTDNEVLIPRDRTYAMFNEWFKCKITMNVYQVL